MNLIKLAGRLIKVTFIVDDWRERGKTTLFEALILLYVSVVVYIPVCIMFKSCVNLYMWASSVCIASLLLMSTRLVRIPTRYSPKRPVPKDSEIEWRSAGEGHELAINFVSSLICIMLGGVFIMLILPALEFIFSWW